MASSRLSARDVEKRPGVFRLASQGGGLDDLFGMPKLLDAVYWFGSLVIHVSPCRIAFGPSRSPERKYLELVTVGSNRIGSEGGRYGRQRRVRRGANDAGVGRGSCTVCSSPRERPAVTHHGGTVLLVSESDGRTQSSSAGGELDGFLVEDGVLAPVEALLHPLVVLPPRHLHLLPLLPPLRESFPFQHPHHLRHGRPVLRRRLCAQQRDLYHHLHLLPVVVAAQAKVTNNWLKILIKQDVGSLDISMYDLGITVLVQAWTVVNRNHIPPTKRTSISLGVRVCGLCSSCHHVLLENSTINENKSGNGVEAFASSQILSPSF
uniref:Uncharacterized protein n=1 Tax=Oryza rufipogon TaxID=4529 RepID=A0A0E0P053_ORYRU